MSNKNTYKKLENLGWDAFSKTGNINDYGIVVASREKQKEMNKQNQEEMNQPGM